MKCRTNPEDSATPPKTPVFREFRIRGDHGIDSLLAPPAALPNFAAAPG